MNAKLFAIGLFVLLGLSIWMSVLFGVTPESKISLAMDSVTAITGLGTIWFGFMIYRDIGLSKKVSEKQFEVVADFLEELKSIIVQVTVESNGTPAYQFSPSKGNLKIRDSLEKWLDFPVVIENENYFGGLKKLFQLRNSIYMPTELINKLKMFSGVTWQSNFAREKNEYVKISINSYPTSWILMFIMTQDDQPITLRHYFDRIQQTLEEATHWIEKHSGGIINT